MAFLRKALLPIILTGFGSVFSVAQDVKSFHADSTGKLFVNPETPVYIYMSTKPDGSDAVRLKSMHDEGNPMYWDGHGPHFLTHLNLYLGRKIRFDLYADGKPPRTSPSFDAEMGIQKGNTIFLSGSTVIEISAVDAHSGLNNVFYSVNGAEFQPYSEPLVFDNEGEYMLKFYAVDNVGNKEDVGDRKLIVDTMPPVTTLEIDGPKHNNVISPKSKFVLSATDANGVKQTYYNISDNEEKNYSKPVSALQLTEGEHTLSWHSTDVVGNTEAKKSEVFFVDRTPPMVFEEIVGNTYMVAGKEFSSGRSQLRVVAVDNKAGVKEIYYSINGNDFQLYEKPIYLSEMTGAVTVRSYAIDNVNNKGTSDASGQEFSMPEVDITGPTIAHDLIGETAKIRDTTWISPSTKIKLMAKDAGAGLNRIEYKLNDSEQQAFTEPFTINKPGIHSIKATAWDNVENLNLHNFVVGVDAAQPELFVNFSVRPFKYESANGEKIAVYSSDVAVFLAATDDISGVAKILFSLNEGKGKAYTEPLKGFKVGEFYILEVKATDKLGNETTKSARFKVE